MKRISTFVRHLALAGLLALVSAGPLLAQAVTTSALTGRVTNPAGEPLASVQIVVTNLATGTQQGVLTRADGRYTLPGLRPGGPYRVEAQGLGFATEAIDDLFLALGQTERLDFVLAEQAILLEGIDVLGERSGAIISRGRTGTGSVITEDAVSNSPTISRDFTDFVRLTPQVSASTPGTSAAGRNNRYNNIQIDGAVNNDLFGLAASGTPGGQANARPITLEAIQEFQVNIAPFDVRQGGFTGANINAVTRGGTNEFSGSAAFFGRNESFIGKYSRFDGAPSGDVAEFEQWDLAFSLGGPIVEDRAHFFVAGELSRRTSPFGGVLGVNTSATPGDVRTITDAVQSRYGYDAGRSDQFPLDTDSNNIFARLDFQLNPDHRLTLRHNFVDAIRDVPNGGPGQTFGLSNSGYTFNSQTNSTVAQLNSNFGGGIFNEFRLGMTFVRDSRDVGQPFPRLQVDVPGGNVRVGPDQFSGANALDQNIIEITNDLSFSRGSHTITLGTSNEFFSFSNLFVRNAFGFWRFPSVDAFLAENPNRYEYSFLLPDGEERAEFPVRRWSAYAQDRWEVTDDFILTYGARIDFTQLPDTPARNPVLARANLERNTDEVPSNALQFNPRVGFNWDVYGDRSTQLRGGLGLFSGRTPFVWISNAYGNTGLDYVRFTCTGDDVPGFTASPNQMPTACAGGDASFAPNEINTVDPDYKFPQIFRASAAVDRELGFLGTIGTLEGLYTRNLNDIKYRNLLINRNDDLPMREGRAQYPRTLLQAQTGEVPVGDVIDLSNTSKGYSYNLTAQLQRPVADGWGFSLAYTYSDAFDVNRGGSSQAVSNWRFNPNAGDPNELPVARSNFVIRNRILATFTQEFSFIEGFPTLASLIYVGESGQRYSFVYNGDVNSDGQTSNDLIWVPANQNEIRFFDNSGGADGRQPQLSPSQSWANLNDFIERNACLQEARGGIIERGACQEPWFNQVDLRLAQEFRTFGTQRAEITLDVLNVLNLLNSDWGRKEFISNESFNLIAVRSANDVENGRVLMQPFSSRETVNSIADLTSRYQMQLGIRYRF
ncbi:MAG: TonB-dependent receptor [Gemmatimonadales bacterium]|nr:MAG: TonB-dependent receptor [Gemmatimonadales bacterium]